MIVEPETLVGLASQSVQMVLGLEKPSGKAALAGVDP